MTVDEVIELMQELKSKGTKHIIIGVWTAAVSYTHLTLPTILRV